MKSSRNRRQLLWSSSVECVERRCCASSPASSPHTARTRATSAARVTCRLDISHLHTSWPHHRLSGAGIGRWRSCLFSQLLTKYSSKIIIKYQWGDLYFIWYIIYDLRITHRDHYAPASAHHDTALTLTPPRVLDSLVSWSVWRPRLPPGLPWPGQSVAVRHGLFCQERSQARVQQQPAAVRGHREGGDKESQSIGHKYWGRSLGPPFTGSEWVISVSTRAWDEG